MGINESSALYNSPGPEVFDGFRFARMRQIPGQENRHQFGSTGLCETLDFGHGMHACPVSDHTHTQVRRDILVYAATHES
jgi:hypothetical protein